MNDLIRLLGEVSDALVDLLVVLAAIAVPLVLLAAWRRGRRLQLMLAGFVNSTGDASLDPVMIGLTHLARQKVDMEIRVVSQRRDQLRAALAGRSPSVLASAHATEPRTAAATAATPSGRELGNRIVSVRRRIVAAIAARRPVPNSARRAAGVERVQDRLGTGLAELLGAAREVAPDRARAAFELLSAMVSQPRGLAVSGILQGRGAVGTPRFGVSIEVRRLADDRSTDSATFWEPEPIVTASEAASLGSGAGQAAPGSAERALALLAPAARWAAVRLVVQSVFPHGARADEQGLDRLLSGMLLAQSVDAFPGQEALFRQAAADDLLEAAESLAGLPLHLAALADTLDRLAASARPDTTLYQVAHRQYARAVDSLSRTTPPMPALLERYRVREATSWLDSGLDGPGQRARAWLRDAPPQLPDDAPAPNLYDAACLYALAAAPHGVVGGEGGADAGGAEVDPFFLHRPGELLLQALTADMADGRLRARALSDSQLATLRPWLVQVLPLLSSARPQDLLARIVPAGAAADRPECIYRVEPDRNSDSNGDGVPGVG